MSDTSEDDSRGVKKNRSDFTEVNNGNVNFQYGIVTLHSKFTTRLLSKQELSRNKGTTATTEESSKRSEEQEISRTTGNNVHGEHVSNLKQATSNNVELKQNETQGNQQYVPAPQHLEVFSIEENINSIQLNTELSTEQIQQLKSILNNYEDRFAYSASNLGAYNGYLIDIETTDEIPVHKSPYRTSAKQREIIEEQVQEMLKNKIIEPSQTHYPKVVWKRSLFSDKTAIV